MYILYGIEKYLQTETAEGYVMGQRRYAVALFDKEQDAAQYVEQSKLPAYSPLAPLDNADLQFHEDSLLHGFHLAVLEPKNQLPLNPTMRRGSTHN